MPESCQHGMANCIHIGHDHDDDCCFNGWWEHKYTCQSCGHEMMSRAHSLRQDGKGMYIAPDFKPKNCPKCKAEKGFV